MVIRVSKVIRVIRVIRVIMTEQHVGHYNGGRYAFAVGAVHQGLLPGVLDLGTIASLDTFTTIPLISSQQLLKYTSHNTD